MGLTGAFTWALGGYVDLRLTALILAGSLVGVQIGAIGTSYVKEQKSHILKGIHLIKEGLLDREPTKEQIILEKKLQKKYKKSGTKILQIKYC